MSSIKRNAIALKLPTSVPLLILFCRHVVQALTGNTRLPNPTPTLADVTKHADDLEASEVAAQTKAKGTVAARDLARKVVEDDLIALKAYVQQVANQHPSEAEAVIASAGMVPRRASRAPKAELSVSMTARPGEVALRALARKRAAAYEWQMSSDGGHTWVPAGTSTVASTQIPGLAAGTTYQFRFRTTITHTTSEWSQPLSFMVH